MWLLLAFLSATLLGFYDSFKKESLRDNAVIPVLFLNTLFASLIFLPFIILSYNTTVLDGSIFHVASGGWHEHKYIIGKSIIVLSSWIFGYFGMKHLPLTIVGPINAHHTVQAYSSTLCRSHQILVVQSADGTKNGCKHYKIYPFVMLEVYAFLLSASAKHKE